MQQENDDTSVLVQFGRLSLTLKAIKKHKNEKIKLIKL